MRWGTARLILPLLFAAVSEQASAQKAGLWEAQTAIDGTPVGDLVRECRIAGAQLDVVRTWAVNCVPEPLRHTGSGIVAQAECGGRNSGLSAKVRRELSGDLDKNYQMVESTRIDGVKEMPTTTVTFRYLGSCASGRHAPPASDTVGQPKLTHTRWLVTTLSLLAQIALMLVPITAAGLVLRQRLRNPRSRATVANIITDAAGTTSVPVLATFTGVRGLPWWYGIAINNARPLLAIEPDGIFFRVVREQRRSFDEIACVDVRQAPGTVNLDFSFRGSIFTFAANVGTIALAGHVIASLPPNVPLSSRAQALRAIP